MYDLIEKKKCAGELSDCEIREMIDGYTKGDIPDYQMSAFLMAVCFNGLSERETTTLTLAMRDSGDCMDLSAIPGIKTDKHSTGGVGDKTTLTLAPLVASLGVPVAKLSGRGLGHTGGTIDKLECFPGLQTALPEDQFIRQVSRIGLAVSGQSAELAPADKKLYALRDTTATVDQMSLIASSIMSKKLASGADAIVLDVKTGSGAFMKKESDARLLAQTMVTIGRNCGKKMAALITNMDQPLGTCVGNTLEVIEAVNGLMGEGPSDFMELVFALGDRMLRLGEKSSSRDESFEMMNQSIRKGRALQKFKEMLKAQGADPSFADHPDSLLHAAYIEPVFSPSDGYVSRIDAETVGRCDVLLGGGREFIGDTIDLSVGIRLNKKVSDSVSRGDEIAVLYANDKKRLSQAKNLLCEAYSFSREPVDPPRMILGEIE